MNDSFPMLFIGDADRQEFRAAALWLQDRGARLVADIPAALNLLCQDDFSPAVIVLAQLIPQRFVAGHLGKLRQAAPLARIMRLMGPWLEGEIRTGKPLPAIQRVYWHQWPGRLLRPMENASNTSLKLSPIDETSGYSLLDSPWSLPVTASDDDRLLANIHADQSETAFPPAIAFPNQARASIPLVAVFARHRETAQSLCDICTQRGWKSVWLRTPPVETPLSVDAVLCDLEFGGTAEQLSTLAALKAVTGAAPLIALVGFPRLDDVSRLQSAGTTAVVSKPFLADDLLWQIEQLLPTKSQE